MYPVYDVDALLLLSIGLSSKRRPAELYEIIAACDLIHGSVPVKSELIDAFARLSIGGLIEQQAAGYALTADALVLVADGRKKADNEERLLRIKAQLAAFALKGEHPVIQIAPEQISAAVQLHLADKAHAGRNLLVPKPKPVIDPRRRPLRRRF